MKLLTFQQSRLKVLFSNPSITIHLLWWVWIVVFISISVSAHCWYSYPAIVMFVPTHLCPSTFRSIPLPRVHLLDLATVHQFLLQKDWAYTPATLHIAAKFEMLNSTFPIVGFGLKCFCWHRFTDVSRVKTISFFVNLQNWWLFSKQ